MMNNEEPKTNPYLADEELRAKYPEVDFDQQKATEVRREIIKDYVRQHGRDMRFLLALIFTDPSDTGACLILRDMITEYRKEMEAAQFEGGPAVKERMEVVKIRAIVYKFRPEANSSETCVNLQAINNSLVEKLFEKDKQITILTNELAEDQVETQRLRDRVDALLKRIEELEGGQPAQAKAKGRSSASIKAKADHPDGESLSQSQSQEEEEATPVTMGEVNEFYSDRAKAAVKALKPRLMRELSLAFASQEDCSRFIDAVPAPKNTEELVNQLFKPFCESGAMKAGVAVEIKWGDKLIDLTDFDPQVQARAINTRTKSYLESFLTTQKAKANKS